MESSVTKTAKDALQAKASAYRAGYRSSCHDEKDTHSYGSLLEQAATALIGQNRRQTPLINAGYAVRIAVILDQVGSFLRLPVLHRHSYDIEDTKSTNRNRKQLIFLGAGLDVTGIWAALLSDPGNVDIHVLEVDFPDVVNAKRDFLERNLKWTRADDNAGEDVVCYSVNGSSLTTFTLVAADLRKASKYGNIAGAAHPNVATLVVSELVVAYLGEVVCHTLLQFCASTLCENRESAMILYEPLKPVEYDRSVLSAYQRCYYAHFKAKLERGESETGQHHSVLAPVGASCVAVTTRLLQYGFAFPRTIDVGTAALYARAHGAMLTPLEMFDEHMALDLHLRSYALAVAFSPSRRITNLILERTLCPWVTGVRPSRFQLDRVRGGSIGWLSAIERCDENQVRTLFEGTYEHLFEMYPGVHRMVKSVLKKDLLATVGKDGDSISDIAQRFRDMGGFFLVATECHGMSDTVQRKVVGCIGMRRYAEGKKSIEGSNMYEITRLFVDPRMRACGVGNELWKFAKGLVMQQDGFSSTTSSTGVSFVATTPVFLKEANAFYPSQGFVIKKETTMGGIPMRTYIHTYNSTSNR